MSKVILGQLANLQQQTTAVNQINANSVTISTAFDNTLSRDGTSPNAMGSNLDMNQFQILNLPAPATINSPVRLVDVPSGTGVPIASVPPVGTSGATVPLLNANNTFSGINTFSVLQNFNTIAILSTNPLTGTNSGISINSLSVGIDEYNAGSGVVDALSVYHNFGTSSAQGARQAFQATLEHSTATSSSNANRNYVAGVFDVLVDQGDGGGAGTEKGAYFCLGPEMILNAGAVHVAEACCAEYDISCATGSSLLDKIGIKIVQLATDRVFGSRTDAALVFANAAGATTGWTNLIQIGDGLNQTPSTTTGSIMTIKGTPTFGIGIDFTNATFGNFAIKCNGFTVNNAGTVVTNGLSTLIAPQFMSSTAPSAGSAFGLGLLLGSTFVAIAAGTGAPSFNAAKGSLYVQTDATTTTTRLWINSSGTTTWTAFTSLA